MKLVQEVRQVVTQVLDGKEALGGLANVVWVAAGGSSEALSPTFLSFTDNARALGLTPSTRTVDVRTVSPTPGLANFFGIDRDGEVFEVTRLRSINGDPVMLETIWLPLTSSDLTGPELDGSLYEALKKRYGVEPATGRISSGLHEKEKRSFT